MQTLKKSLKACQKQRIQLNETEAVLLFRASPMRSIISFWLTIAPEFIIYDRYKI